MPTIAETYIKTLGVVETGEVISNAWYNCLKNTGRPRGFAVPATLEATLLEVVDCAVNTTLHLQEVVDCAEEMVSSPVANLVFLINKGVSCPWLDGDFPERETMDQGAELSAVYPTLEDTDRPVIVVLVLP